MPRGYKSAYTEKHKRQAEHIEERESDQGRSEEAAAAYARAAELTGNAASREWLLSRSTA